MCIDFTDLNKAYPKDSFPLLRIDQLVDATVDITKSTWALLMKRTPRILLTEGYTATRLCPSDLKMWVPYTNDW